MAGYVELKSGVWSAAHYQFSMLQAAEAIYRISLAFCLLRVGLTISTALNCQLPMAHCYLSSQTASCSYMYPFISLCLMNSGSVCRFSIASSKSTCRLYKIEKLKNTGAEKPC